MSQGRIPSGPGEQSNPCFDPNAAEETNMGYGKLLIRVPDMSSKTVTVSVRNSFEAENPRHQEMTSCFFCSATWKELFSEFLATHVRGSETYCIAKGDQSCVFELGPALQSSKWKL